MASKSIQRNSTRFCLGVWSFLLYFFAASYNEHPVCQPFFFPDTEHSAWLYMTIIIVFNFLAFIYIAVAYVIIYKASSRPSVRKSVRKRSRQWRKDNRKMQRKILLLGKRYILLIIYLWSSMYILCLSKTLLEQHNFTRVVCCNIPFSITSKNMTPYAMPIIPGSWPLI